MEQLKVDTNDLPSVVKKNIAAVAVSVSSTEAFPTTGLALQLEGSPGALGRRPYGERPHKLRQSFVIKLN
jgi:hypothetical protein